MKCPKCGSELVGESTLSGMKIYQCRSSVGKLGIAQSDICKGREPLWNENLILRNKLEQITIILEK